MRHAATAAEASSGTHRRQRPPPASSLGDAAGHLDSSPIYLHGVSAVGATRNLILVTTTYGKTLAIDAGQRAHPLDLHPTGHQPLGR